MQSLVHPLHPYLPTVALRFGHESICRVLQVSDLDGTMVGDGDWADTATQEFGVEWLRAGARCSSVATCTRCHVSVSRVHGLPQIQVVSHTPRQVYNTGRSLGQFISLLTEKAGKLALPDALITAVGTKVTASLVAPWRRDARAAPCSCRVQHAPG